MHIPTEPSKQANNSDINDCKYPKIQAHQETPLTSNSHVENSQTEKKRNKHFISAELEKVLFNRMKMDHMKEGIKILSLDKQTKLQRYNAIIVICHSLDGKVLQQQQKYTHKRHVNFLDLIECFVSMFFFFVCAAAASFSIVTLGRHFSCNWFHFLKWTRQTISFQFRFFFSRCTQNENGMKTNRNGGAKRLGKLTFFLLCNWYWTFRKFVCALFLPFHPIIFRRPLKNETKKNSQVSLFHSAFAFWYRFNRNVKFRLQWHNHQWLHFNVQITIFWRFAGLFFFLSWHRLFCFHVHFKMRLNNKRKRCIADVLS